MTLDRFESPKALLTWAGEDIEKFKILEEKFFDADPYEQFTDFDADTGQYAHKIRFTQDLPLEMRKRASHAINDLRHALDQAFVVALDYFKWVNPKGSGKGVIYFPWSMTLADLRAQIYRKAIPKELHPVLEGSEPYPAQPDGTGDDIFRQLGSIAGPNKHQVALSAFGSMSLAELKIAAGGSSYVIPYQPWDDAKREFTIGYWPPGANPDYDLKFAPYVTFSNVDTLAYRRAGQVLDYFGWYVNQVVRQFEIRVAEAGG